MAEGIQRRKLRRKKRTNNREDPKEKKREQNLHTWNDITNKKIGNYDLE